MFNRMFVTKDSKFVVVVSEIGEYNTYNVYTTNNSTVRDFMYNDVNVFTHACFKEDIVPFITLDVKWNGVVVQHGSQFDMVFNTSNDLEAMFSLLCTCRDDARDHFHFVNS